jgi:hypothetical protein
VFYSVSGPLLEREVKNVQRSSYTIIEFVVDGTDYKATFGSVLAPIATELDMGGKVLAVTVREPAVLATGTTFECLP